MHAMNTQTTNLIGIKLHAEANPLVRFAVAFLDVTC